MRIVGFRTRLVLGSFLSTSFRMPGETNSKSLFRTWFGERQEDGQGCCFRYQFTFSGNGPDGPKFGVSYRYSYSVTRASVENTIWTIAQRGSFALRASDSNLWQIRMDLHPAEDSQAPPAEEARIALVKLAGLPNNSARSFRIRGAGELLDFQLTDAPAADETDRAWQVRSSESGQPVRPEFAFSMA